MEKVTPPLLNPRHADGRPMTEDEIRGLEGRELNEVVAISIMDLRWVYTWDREPRRAALWDYLRDEKNLVGDGTFLPTTVERDKRFDPPRYSTDIAAAFTVDRPEWRWWVIEHEPQFCDGPSLEIRVYGPKFDQMRCFTTQYPKAKAGEPEHKPSPQDHARARCIAALLLAAKIGQ